MKKIALVAAFFACFAIAASAQDGKSKGKAVKDVKTATASRPAASAASGDQTTSANKGASKRRNSGKVSTAHLKSAKKAQTVSKPN